MTMETKIFIDCINVQNINDVQLKMMSQMVTDWLTVNLPELLFATNKVWKLLVTNVHNVLELLFATKKVLDISWSVPRNRIVIKLLSPSPLDISQILNTIPSQKVSMWVDCGHVDRRDRTQQHIIRCICYWAFPVSLDVIDTTVCVKRQFLKKEMYSPSKAFVP